MVVSDLTSSEREADAAWLGSSEMAGRVRARDWSATALGAPDTWSPSLRSAVGICLRSLFPMAVYWGPELICVYNDAQRDVLGDLHPQALGATARELHRESWEIVGPQIEAAMQRGESTRADDQPLTIARRGGREVVHLTYSISPLPDDDTVGGVLVVCEGTTLPNARLRTDAAVTQGRLGERARHDDELRALLSDLRAAQHRVAVAGDTERRRIERDLHDGAQQRLMALRLELGLLEERLQDDPRRALEMLRGLRRDLDEALDELRELAHGLHPPLLASDGLEAALGVMARRSAIPVTIAATQMTRTARSIESTVYFCCLEALQNATKHAGPNAHVTIGLEMADGVMRFAVSDSGAGFDPCAVRPGHGLINLRDRLQALGGDASVTSSPGAGTIVAGHIPLP